MSAAERILVATDLTPHSDRALDRAVALACERDAQLTVLHVIEHRPTHVHSHRIVPVSALTARIERQLAMDVSACRDRATIQIEQGQPADVIERIARDGRYHVVVVGGERVDRLGQRSLGKTVERLLRTTTVPLLVVADRPRGPYRNVAVAVDFSRVSVLTTELAASMFPAQRIRIVHAYQPLTYGRGESLGEPGQFLEAARMEYAEWIAEAALPADIRDRLDAHLAIGHPSRVLREAAEQGQFDLLVLGSHGHGRLYELFIGSVAREILAELPCDCLFLGRADEHGEQWRQHADAGPGAEPRSRRADRML
jgi:nucleotide-binding universal stress UspA family protein